jgi:hypothetical protein
MIVDRLWSFNLRMIPLCHPKAQMVQIREDDVFFEIQCKACGQTIIRWSVKGSLK